MRTTLHAGIAFALALLAGGAQAASFTVIDVPAGQTTGLSHNGRIVSGIAGKAAWRWTPARGAEILTGFSDTNGMSGWGQPLAGATTDGDGNTVAAVAYSNSNLVGPTVIGPFPGGGPGFDGHASTAYDVSDTGVAVGLAYDATNNPIAFRWSAAEGMTRLPVNRPANYSRANAISADGSTIVGWNDQDNGGRTGVIWRGDQVIDLTYNGEGVGEALATNSDGSVVVGTSVMTELGSEAWRWTAATGVQPIGFIGFMGTAFGFGVSDDGNVVVGASGFGWDRSAVIWTPETGMQLLSDYAAAQGAEIPAGWTLMTASAVSADGKTIAGWGMNDVGLNPFVLDLHASEATQALVEATGTVNWNDLTSGPFAGLPVGTQVSMSFRITAEDALEMEPDQATKYPVVLDSFRLESGAASETLVANAAGPGLILSNDYPKSDGIHLFSTPTATAGQTLEFELFNPGGDLFDSDSLARINRTFGPEFFEKIAWSVQADGGATGMWLDLESVTITDVGQSDTLFADGFDDAP
ncbi:MAG TPA: hypothetical protein VMR06_10630 [Dokdonella sp.]|uniref:hypothetical protein n=1 Tax=Dokdonella sp. TaxID=2291710 RepID=UPI002B6374E4|nr:hypothetical protein [Dokdonella sp.]HUD42435.1 hypothetical protein [Dokdonella sp.]